MTLSSAPEAKTDVNLMEAAQQAIDDDPAGNRLAIRMSLKVGGHFQASVCWSTKKKLASRPEHEVLQQRNIITAEEADKTAIKERLNRCPNIILFTIAHSW